MLIWLIAPIPLKLASSSVLRLTCYENSSDCKIKPATKRYSSGSLPPLTNRRANVHHAQVWVRSSTSCHLRRSFQFHLHIPGGLSQGPVIFKSLIAPSLPFIPPSPHLRSPVFQVITRRSAWSSSLASSESSMCVCVRVSAFDCRPLYKYCAHVNILYSHF